MIGPAPNDWHQPIWAPTLHATASPGWKHGEHRHREDHPAHIVASEGLECKPERRQPMMGASSMSDDDEHSRHQGMRGPTPTSTNPGEDGCSTQRKGWRKAWAGSPPFLPRPSTWGIEAPLLHPDRTRTNSFFSLQTNTGRHRERSTSIYRKTPAMTGSEAPRRTRPVIGIGWAQSPVFFMPELASAMMRM